jgi:hypothetical protein
VPHREDEHRQGERCADPEAPRHFAQLRVFLFAAGKNIFRFQRHPADRAIPWVILLDLGMHGAGVDRLRSLAESRIGFQRHPAFRTAAGHVALHRFAHRAEILLRRLARAHGPGRFVRPVGAVVAAIRAHRRNLSGAVCRSARSSFGFLGLTLARPLPSPWPITQARVSLYT